MTLHGHVSNGEIVFDRPVSLPEGAAVHVEIVVPQSITEDAPNVAKDMPSLVERLPDYVGKFEGQPPDASVNLDHYLYGTPKRQ